MKIYQTLTLVLSVTLLLSACGNQNKNTNERLDHFIENSTVTMVNHQFVGYDKTKYEYVVTRKGQGFGYMERVNGKDKQTGTCQYFERTPGDDGVDYTLSQCSGPEEVVTVEAIPRVQEK